VALTMAADANSQGGIDDPAARMQRSWDRNAAAWTDAVREGKIASRRAGTDAAIIQAVLRERPRRVIDIGCGEGWLARALSAQGIDVVGIDASLSLIEAARAQGGGRFETLAYDRLAAHAPGLGAPFDLAVCNFSLLEADLSPVLAGARAALAAHGKLLVQTVHPWIANGDARYADGWRTETFAAFGGAFAEAMPWYFRTLASWVDAIAAGGFAIERCEEPVDAERAVPLSLLLVATPVEPGR
jgi:2-polyprenyl-3-methyl-5-hydroxy-6-metoxy-1,4-benzoquinol methylase